MGFDQSAWLYIGAVPFGDRPFCVWSPLRLRLRHCYDLQPIKSFFEDTTLFHQFHAPLGMGGLLGLRN